MADDEEEAWLIAEEGAANVIPPLMTFSRISTLVIVAFIMSRAAVGILYDRPGLQKLVGKMGSENVFIPAKGGWLLHDLETTKSGNGGTCWSMQKRHLYYPPSDFHYTPECLTALRDYEAMHTRCVGGVKNWREHYKTPEEGLGDCKYIVWKTLTEGLGNQFVSLWGAFEYALLTNRALLINTDTSIDKLICNIFPHSSMFTPPDLPLDELNAAPQQGSFYESEIQNPDNQDPGRFHQVAIFLMHWYFGTDKWFFCETMQKKLAEVRWITFESNQYIGPALFFIPSFQSRLLLLFPDRQVSIPIARYLILPVNLVWERVTRVYNGYLARADKRVGVQVRSFTEYDPGVGRRVLECGVGKNVFAPAIGKEQWAAMMKDHGNPMAKINESAPPPHSVSVFVATLSIEYYEFLRKEYTERPTEDGSDVMVYSESNDRKELHALSNDQSAIVEMCILSLSDTLLVSFRSTFGYVVNAIAARQTYFMNIIGQQFGDSLPYPTNGRPVCEKAWSHGACFHVPPKDLECPGGNPYSEKDSKDWLPYISRCQDVREGIFVLPLM